MEKTFKDYYKFPLHIDELMVFKAVCDGDVRMMAYDVNKWYLSKAVYQELIDIINGTCTCQDSVEWSKPLKYTNKGCDIYADGEEHPIITVRGFGRLTGIGGHKLSIDDAIEVQNQFIEYILGRLNKREKIDREDD